MDSVSSTVKWMLEYDEKVENVTYFSDNDI